MKRLIVFLSVILAALIFTGCAGYSPYYGGHQRAIVGTGLGAAGGALLGGAYTGDSDGAVVGGLLGGAAGGLIGHSMDKAQRPPAYYYQGQPAYYGGGYRRAYAEEHAEHRHHHRHEHGYRDYD